MRTNSDLHCFACLLFVLQCSYICFSQRNGFQLLVFPYRVSLCCCRWTNFDVTPSRFTVHPGVVPCVISRRCQSGSRGCLQGDRGTFGLFLPFYPVMGKAQRQKLENNATSVDYLPFEPQNQQTAHPCSEIHGRETTSVNR